MSEKKTIVFNDSLITNKTRKNNGVKKQKKEKPKPVIKPNTLKKSLLEKIKKHQQKEKITKTVDVGNNNTSVNDMDFHNNFINSMEYLNKISEKQNKEKREKKRKNKTLKKPQEGGNRNNPNIKMDQPLVSVDLPNDFDSNSSQPIFLSNFTENNYANVKPPMIKKPIIDSTQIIPPKAIDFNSNEIEVLPERPYGCLKGGTKPTFREYHNKTLKKSHYSSSNKPIKIKSDRQQKLNDLKKSYKKIKQTKRNTKTTTFHLGRTNKKVSVLIKNNSTRRKIKREHGLLKQKSLNEIKKHLYDKNLIKIGSTAPNDVLRTLYEQSVLAGDINNISNDIQLHNFMNK
jgi:hypothetical protein